MKNIFLVFLSFILVIGTASAQKKKTTSVKPVSVPENVDASFKSLYTVAGNNKWNKNYSGNYVANFTNADSLMQTVEFSGTGAMIKSKIAYAITGLPENINTSILAQYPDTKIVEAAKMQMPGVAPYYRVKIMTPENTKKELLISEDGTITE